MSSFSLNPFNVQTYIFTVVTADLEASLHFYRDILGYNVTDEGTLGKTLPSIEGAGEFGRRCVLLRPREDTPTERGVLRLLEAPRGARANRPRPGSSNIDTGLIGYQTHTTSWEKAYRHLTEAGLTLTSPPLPYAHVKISALPDEEQPPHTASKSVSLYVPGGGEFLYISCAVDPATLQPVEAIRKIPDSNLYGKLFAHILNLRDRWPVFDFYERAFGLKPEMEGYAGRDTINVLCDLPKRTQFQFGFFPDHCFEYWELRQYRPTATPPWPTSLDKTGLAMTTFLVDDLAVVKQRVRESGIIVLGEGALPTPEAPFREGFYVRGVLGELYEVIGRR
jgi:catechol 2,3-dioxygenase-like lactoylglutathione lyase family enzyme